MTYVSWHLVNKVYFSDITVKNIYECFTRKMAAKAGWHWNYVTVTPNAYVLTWTGASERRTAAE